MDDFQLPEGVIPPPGFTAAPKKDEQGNQLYLCPQPDEEVSYTVTAVEKSTQDTGNPVMTTKQVPHLTPDGDQMTYEMTQSEVQEDGSVIQVGTGQFIKVFTTEEVQETDAEGAPLFWLNVEEILTRFDPRPDKEITAEDPEYIEGLQEAYEFIPILPPPPDFEKALSDKLSYLEVAQYNEIYSSFQSSALGEAKTYNYSEKAAADFRGKCILLSINPSITSVLWYTFEDGPVEHTKDQFIQVATEAGEREERLKMKGFQLEAELTLAYKNKDYESMMAIIW